MSKLREYTREEYEKDLKAEVNQGLYESVKKRCDIIAESVLKDFALSYIDISYIHEQLVEILDLIRLSSG